MLCQSQDPFKPSNLQQSQYNTLRESTQKKNYTGKIKIFSWIVPKFLSQFHSH